MRPSARVCLHLQASGLWFLELAYYFKTQPSRNTNPAISKIINQMSVSDIYASPFLPVVTVIVHYMDDYLPLLV